MYALRSLILTVILLVLTRDDISALTRRQKLERVGQPQPEDESLHQCDLPEYFNMETTDLGKIHFNKPQLIVSVPNDGFSALEYPGGTGITFENNNITVTFNGNVVFDDPEINCLLPNQGCQFFKNRISGVAQRIPDPKYRPYRMEYNMLDCHVYLMLIGVEKQTATSIITSEILRRAESCIEAVVCSKIGKLQIKYKQGIPNAIGLAQLPGLVGQSYENPAENNHEPVEPFKHAIASLMKNDMKMLLRTLGATGQTTFTMPAIDSHFTETRGTVSYRGHFQTTNGTFSGMDNLASLIHPTLSHEGTKFIISRKYDVNFPRISYNYKLDYDSKTSEGNMTLLFNYVNLEATFIADYANLPCVLSLGHVKVLDFGETTKRFTDAGPLETLIKAREWFDKKALDDIARMLEQRLQHAIKSAKPGLENFNCERFRP